MKILDYKVILPAFFTYEYNDAINSIFCYIDHNKKKVIIPDVPVGIDEEEFSKLAYNFVKDGCISIPSPKIPDKIFENLNSKNYTG